MKIRANSVWPFWVVVLLLGCVLLDFRGVAQLLPFPLTANQRGTVYCLENPSIDYDAYLPPGYATNGTPLPILYTMSASGGGMVGKFQSVCSNLNIITIGVKGSKNGAPWEQILGEMHAVSRDIRQRVLYDPTAEFAGGMSGGGQAAYMFSRLRAQHMAGVLPMAGWLGRGNSGDSVEYYSVDRVQTNLLVARTTGNSDDAALFYNAFDSNYLFTCGATVNDWSFNGGHVVPGDAVKTKCLNWLVSQRVPAGPTDRSNALVLATNWQCRITAGQREGVLRECVSNLMNRPRSWFAHQAQLTLDQLMTNDTAFRSLNVSNLAQGDFASDLFFFYAYAAATNGDWPRYGSCMKALTGITVTNGFNGTIVISNIIASGSPPVTNGYVYITGTNGDRPGDIYSLLVNYNHYPSPRLQCAPDGSAGRVNLCLCKDTPGLAYSVQWRSNLVSDTWQDGSGTVTDTNTTWSSRVDVPAGSGGRYFRVGAVPLPAYSPPW